MGVAEVLLVVCVRLVFAVLVVFGLIGLCTCVVGFGFGGLLAVLFALVGVLAVGVVCVFVCGFWLRGALVWCG